MKGSAGGSEKNCEAILALLQSRREDIRRFGVRRLSLFGSIARGEAGGASDLDFVVELEKKTFDAYMDLKAYLEDLFGCEVDLVLADAIKPRLRPHIMAEAVDVPGL